MRVGSIVYATDQGLGILAKSFFDNGVVTDVLVMVHSHYTSHPEWFNNADVIYPRNWSKERRKVLQFCEKMDCMLFFETPFYWEVIDHCNRNRIRNFLMPMYECMPKHLPFHPMYFVNPSLLDMDYYPNGVFLPVPVEYPWTLREKAVTFVHNAGHGGLKNRNGTGEILDAWKYVKTDAKLVIRSQKRLQWNVDDHRIEVRTGTLPYEQMFASGDVFLFPEKFNGLSLPLQEARAAGMLVMCGDRYPMNTWLPQESLIPVASYVTDSISGAYNDFQSAVIRPEDIARKVDEYYGKDIREYSEGGKEWAKTMSWTHLGPKYKELLCPSSTGK